MESKTYAMKHSFADLQNLKTIKPKHVKKRLGICIAKILESILKSLGLKCLCPMLCRLDFLARFYTMWIVGSMHGFKI